jgi:hypothetical protein
MQEQLFNFAAPFNYSKMCAAQGLHPKVPTSVQSAESYK